MSAFTLDAMLRPKHITELGVQVSLDCHELPGPRVDVNMQGGTLQVHYCELAFLKKSQAYLSNHQYVEQHWDH